MTLEFGQEHTTRGVWCVVATATSEPGKPHERRLDLDLFAPGAKLYLFPPLRPDGDPQVKVYGFRGRGGRLVSGAAFVKHLDDWQSEFVTNKEVMRAISPPWDDDDESKNLGRLLVAWKGGGDWPMLELREWNRSRGQRTVGSGTLMQRIGAALKSLVPTKNGKR